MSRSLWTFVSGTCFAALIAVLAGPQTAQAGHDSPLYIAADHYRDAVSHFEDEARRVRTIDRTVLRLIDDFEDQTSDVRSAARHPDRSDRLAREFNDVQFLQARTEQAVFGSGCPIIAQALTPCWGDVLGSFAALQQQMAYVQPYVSGRPALNCDVHHGSGYLTPAYPPTPSVVFPGRTPLPLPRTVPHVQQKPISYPHRGSRDNSRDFNRGPSHRDAPRPGNYRASIPSRKSVPKGAEIGLVLLNGFLNR
ncbi:putative signal peptide and transmembrane protein [Rhodopirellula islandica]|uniref:Signal peptide and transmembrane protein n=1 Tax=Rhodopirellula islandica TaxID=595434 RepID=A0A0J1B767_RHOIS|nr:hypothetical protein [Rhodopirellula islandica]KLU02582.1 putative signal peptide and transmembrane protein [Rhodopirellula islandica]